MPKAQAQPATLNDAWREGFRVGFKEGFTNGKQASNSSKSGTEPKDSHCHDFEEDMPLIKGPLPQPKSRKPSNDYNGCDDEKSQLYGTQRRK